MLGPSPQNPQGRVYVLLAHVEIFVRYVEPSQVPHDDSTY